MSTIDRAEVERIAHLSRLELDEASLDAMTSHMKNMLGFVASLDRHDTKGVSARVHGGEHAEKPPLRPDRVRPSLAPDEALAMAPAKGKDGFKVPGVVDRVEG
ncbi:MAG: Asp-tRNA(Asn)/Glu-tRNA(Gln) amidotransferase subunit GatC [Planctomycetota bacterium]